MRLPLLTTILLLFSITADSQAIYTFNGNGNWSDSLNWFNKLPPPQTLPSGASIIVNPAAGGECVLDVHQFISDGASIDVQQGKIFIIKEKLLIAAVANKTGLIPSNPDSLAKVPVFDTSKPFGEKPLHKPLGVDLVYELSMPPPGNQGEQGSCAAWAAAYAARSYHLLKDECNLYYYLRDGQLDKSRIFSPAFIFNEVKRTNFSVCTDGISLYNALATMKTAGVATMLKMDYNPSVIGCYTPPNTVQQNNAAFFRIKDFNRIYDISESSIKKTLAMGFPIMIGVKIDKGFHQDGRFIWSQRKGEDVTDGKHAIVIYGWDDLKGAFKILNSWGTADWGYDGHGWIGYDYLKEVMMKVENETIGNYGNWEAFVMKTTPTVYAPDIKVSYDTILKGRSVTYTDNTEPAAASVSWSFPGGFPSTSTERKVTVLYPDAGDFTATLTIQPECAVTTKTTTKKITVLDSNDGLYTDPRDGKVYPYKQIGSQVWMTKNMNYAAPNSYCYNNLESNCDTYGRLYNWQTALTVAPPGWHLASNEEWDKLISEVGEFAQAAGALKSTLYWNQPNTGATNSSGFTAFPGGFKSATDGLFYYMGGNGYWRTSTEIHSANAWVKTMQHTAAYVNSNNYNKEDFFAVRCIMN